LVVVTGVTDDLTDDVRSRFGERHTDGHRRDLHEADRIGRLVDTDEYAEGLPPDHLAREGI
jgi:hypothetical protein